LQIITVQGQRVWVRFIGEAVRGAGGRNARVQGSFQHITDRKQADEARAAPEAQLRESQKMEPIGTLAGGVAHDFNNILGAILGNVELARQDAAANPRTLESLEEIRKAGHRRRSHSADSLFQPPPADAAPSDGGPTCRGGIRPSAACEPARTGKHWL
jgi:signal transduction histidine kinase